MGPGLIFTARGKAKISVSVTAYKTRGEKEAGIVSILDPVCRLINPGDPPRRLGKKTPGAARSFFRVLSAAGGGGRAGTLFQGRGETAALCGTLVNVVAGAGGGRRRGYLPLFRTKERKKQALAVVIISSFIHMMEEGGGGRGDRAFFSRREGKKRPSRDGISCSPREKGGGSVSSLLKREKGSRSPPSDEKHVLVIFPEGKGREGIASPSRKKGGSMALNRALGGGGGFATRRKGKREPDPSAARTIERKRGKKGGWKLSHNCVFSVRSWSPEEKGGGRASILFCRKKGTPPTIRIRRAYLEQPDKKKKGREVSTRHSKPRKKRGGDRISKKMPLNPYHWW